MDCDHWAGTRDVVIQEQGVQLILNLGLGILATEIS